MHRSLLIALGALLCWPAAGARAQDTLPTGNLRIQILSIEGRDPETARPSLDFLPINQRECAQDIEIKLRIDNIPSRAIVVDFWRTDSADCSDSTLRSDNTQTGCTPLSIAADQNTSGNSQKDIIVTATELVPCEDGRTSEFQIFVLAASAEMSTGDVGQNFGRFTARVDTSAPSIPAGLEGGDGEVQFQASWESTDEQLREYLVFVNDSGCTSGGGGDGGTGSDGGPLGDGGPADGGGGAMDAGGGTPDGGGGTPDGGGGADGGTVISDLPEVPPGFELARSVDGSANSAGISAEAYPLGSSVTLGIVAVDEAKNFSEMATVCVTRVDTTGFCEARGGCPKDCSVSAPGAGRPATGGPAAAGLALLVLGGVLAARRRRR